MYEGGSVVHLLILQIVYVKCNTRALLLLQDAEMCELRAAAKNRGSGGDLDLETIPDCVSLGSFRRKSSAQSNTLPSDTCIPNGKYFVYCWYFLLTEEQFC